MRNKICADCLLLESIVKDIMLNPTEYEQKLDVCGNEFSTLYISLDGLKEIVEQSNDNSDVYQEYGVFFDHTYNAYHNELIRRICRLQDESRDSLSIVKMLKENIQNYKDENDEQVQREQDILKRIGDIPLSKALKIFRNKLGRAHLDGQNSINQKTQTDLYQKHKRP